MISTNYRNEAVWHTSMSVGYKQPEVEKENMPEPRLVDVSSWKPTLVTNAITTLNGNRNHCFCNTDVLFKSFAKIDKCNCSFHYQNNTSESSSG